jgi:hypothetical protein
MKKARFGRRDALRLTAASLVTVATTGCGPSSSAVAPPARDGGGSGGGGDASNEEESLIYDSPRVLTTTLDSATGRRTFDGPAWPQNIRFRRSSGAWANLHDLFPNAHDPFGINKSLSLGAGGFALEVVDRASLGVRPPNTQVAWALNMVPFGVAIDGCILDPSGPWYDSGPADPNNPFDRRCSGWEYDPIFATVADLVGVPLEARGHTQPSGMFHYHGFPRLMVANLLHAIAGTVEARRPLLLGYSADGYPIVGPHVPAGSSSRKKDQHLFSGYILRTGTRSAVPHTNPELVPSGQYDGMFVQDWVYDPDRKRALVEEALAKSGAYLALRADDVAAGRAEYALLDATNGLVLEGAALADYAQATYAYVLTEDWPEVPRLLNFQPGDAFRNNIIPFDGPRGGRKQLYNACSGDLVDVHRWDARAPY